MASYICIFIKYYLNITINFEHYYLATPIRSPATNILYTIIPCLILPLAVSLLIITLSWQQYKQQYYEKTFDIPKQVLPRVNTKVSI